MLKKLLSLFTGKESQKQTPRHGVRRVDRDLYEVVGDEGRVLIPVEFGDIVDGVREQLVYAAKSPRWEGTDLPIPADEYERLLKMVEAYVGGAKGGVRRA